MRKFNGLLLVSDFDNTLVYTEEALQKCVDMPPVSDENRAAIEYLIREVGFHRIEAKCCTENTASERVMQKLGMNTARTLLRQRRPLA